MTPPGAVRIRVPASAANLGPGYDSFGLALGLYDEVVAARSDAGLQITVAGVGADSVPTDERHLVHQAASRAWAQMGVDAPGVRMHCVNRIPHGGGQGSSAAAIVAGILLARSLVPDGVTPLDDDAVFALATDMEGHPDNVAPALFGGFTVAWMTATGAGMEPRVVQLRPHPAVRAVALTAEASCSTAAARAALPAQVPHADAAANSARAALLVHALTHEPGLLFDATEDFLHQRYRAGVMPSTAALLGALRADGWAAVLSGAGPSILVLGSELPDVDSLSTAGFHATVLDIPTTGAQIDDIPFGTARPRARRLAQQ